MENKSYWKSQMNLLKVVVYLILFKKCYNQILISGLKPERDREQMNKMFLCH